MTWKRKHQKKCAKQLKLAVERESAKRSPADYSGYPIVLTDSYVKEFLKFYLMRSNAAYVYPGYSDYKEGYDIMSDISIEGVPEYPYSAEGVKTGSRMIIEHGIVKNIHGNVMHLSYLNRPYIGMYENLHCVCNGEPMDRLLNGKYILVKTSPISRWIRLQAILAVSSDLPRYLMRMEKNCHRRNRNGQYP